MKILTFNQFEHFLILLPAVYILNYLKISMLKHIFWKIIIHLKIIVADFLQKR